MPSELEGHFEAKACLGRAIARRNGSPASAAPCYRWEAMLTEHVAPPSDREENVMSSLRGAVADASPVDMNRVRQVRQRIESGDYEIDPLRIAEKLIAFERALD